MRTGGSAETVALGLEPSNWQDRDMLGSPLRTFDRRITGAGRITGGYASSCCDLAAGASVCRRGGAPDTGNGIDLSLPADSVTTVSYRVALAAPPWPAPIFLGIAARIPATAAKPDQTTTYHLGPQQFTIRGRTGVHIQLAIPAGTRRVHNEPYPVLAADRTAEITGATHPRVRGAQLRIGYASTTSTRRGTIGSVTTDARGAFRLAWTPRAKGTYTITSAYPHPAPGLLADHNCDLAITVR
jgi:hypothetical protein